ncbi:MAG: translocated intimin receptor Tir [Acidobacteria bacterium]|nr:translocated intimin receptor Tir [Acidobacteriota bacterium]
MLKQPVLRAVLTDLHFWVPVVVLVLGTALLAVMR